MAENLGAITVVTTQLVLTEALDAMAGAGEFRRRFAVQMVRELEQDPDVEIVPHTDAQFQAAVERYGARADGSGRHSPRPQAPSAPLRYRIPTSVGTATATATPASPTPPATTPTATRATSTASPAASSTQDRVLSVSAGPSVSCALRE